MTPAHPELLDTPICLRSSLYLSATKTECIFNSDTQAFINTCMSCFFFHPSGIKPSLLLLHEDKNHVDRSKLHGLPRLSLNYERIFLQEYTVFFLSFFLSFFSYHTVTRLVRHLELLRMITEGSQEKWFHFSKENPAGG